MIELVVDIWPVCGGEIQLEAVGEEVELFRPVPGEKLKVERS